jgi:anti-anti-sigma factor
MDRQLLVVGPLTIEVESQNGCHLVRANGELDLGSAAALEQSLDEALSAHGEEVVLDLGELTFIDSAGLRCLLRATYRARADGDRLQMLAARSDDVNFLLGLTGIGDRLPIGTDSAGLERRVEVEMKPDAAGAAGITPRTTERVDDL